MALAEEVIEDYETSLADLNFNSKPLINMLTMLADDHEQHASQIVKVIEDHILKAKSTRKLSVLYLIDSIIKNLPKSCYKLEFEKNIVHVFTSVFEQVDEKTRGAMYKLRQTWTTIFSNKQLYNVDVKINTLMDPAWPVTAKKPEQSIHVNPKFLRQEVELEVEEPDTDEELKKQEALMRQQLIAKQQELQKLKQQKLELELAETKAQLEQLSKPIKTRPATSVVKNQELVAEPVKPLPVVSKEPTEPEVPPPAVRDPRLPNRDPRRPRDPRLRGKEPPASTSLSSAASSATKGNVSSSVNSAFPPGSRPLPQMKSLPSFNPTMTSVGQGASESRVPPLTSGAVPQHVNPHFAGTPSFIPPNFPTESAASASFPGQTGKNTGGHFFKGEVFLPEAPINKDKASTPISATETHLPGTGSSSSSASSSHQSSHRKPHTSPSSRTSHSPKDIQTTKTESMDSKSKSTSSSPKGSLRKDDRFSSSKNVSRKDDSSSRRGSSSRDSKERDKDMSKDRDRASRDRERGRSRSPHKLSPRSARGSGSSNDIKSHASSKSKDPKSRLSGSDSSRNSDQHESDKSIDSQNKSRDKKPLVNRKKDGEGSNEGPHKSSSRDIDLASVEKMPKKDSIKKSNELSKNKVTKSRKSDSKDIHVKKIKEETRAAAADKNDNATMNVGNIKVERMDTDFSEKPQLKRDLDKGHREKDKEEGHGPSAVKKPRVEEEKLSEDLSDLFGGEDIDYRSAPVESDNLGLPLKSPSSKGWDKFKARHPEHYAYDIELKKQREEARDVDQRFGRSNSMPEDIDLRFQRQNSSAWQQRLMRNKQLDNSEDVDIPQELSSQHHENILIEAEKKLKDGSITHEQHQEILKQLSELMHIQKLQEQSATQEKAHQVKTEGNDSDYDMRMMSPRDDAGQSDDKYPGRKPEVRDKRSPVKIARIDREKSPRKNFPPMLEQRGPLQNLYPDGPPRTRQRHIPPSESALPDSMANPDDPFINQQGKQVPGRNVGNDLEDGREAEMRSPRDADDRQPGRKGQDFEGPENFGNTPFDDHPKRHTFPERRGPSDGPPDRGPNFDGPPNRSGPNFEGPSDRKGPYFDGPPDRRGPHGDGSSNMRGPRDGSQFNGPPDRRGPPDGPPFDLPPDRRGPHERSFDRTEDRRGPQDGPPIRRGPHNGQPFDGPPNGRGLRDGPNDRRGPNDGPQFDGPQDRRGPHDGPPDRRGPHDGPPFDGPLDRRGPHDGPPFDGPPDRRGPHDGPPFDGPPDRRGPHDGPPFDGPPDRRGPHDGPPFDGPPDRRGPHVGPPFDGPPDRRGPHDGQPDRRGPHDGPPFDGPPDRRGPHDGPPFDGPPDRRGPHDGPPFDGPPDRRGPHDGPPFDGPPDRRGPHDGPPFNGPPDRRVPHDGQPFDCPPDRRGPHDGPQIGGPPDRNGPPFDGPPDRRGPHDGPPDRRGLHDGPQIGGPPDRSGPLDGPPFDGPPDRRGPHDGPPYDGPPDRRGPHDGPPDKRGPHDGPPFDGPPDRRGPRDGPPDKRGPHDGPPFDGPADRRGLRDGPPFDGPPDRRGPHDGPPFDGPPDRRGPHDGPPDKRGPHDGPPFDGPPDRRGPRDGPPDKRGPHDGPPFDGPADRRGPRDGPPFDGPPDKRGPRDGPPFDGPPDRRGPHDGPPDKRGPHDGPPFDGKPDRRGPPFDGPPDRRGPNDGPPFDRRGPHDGPPFDGPQDRRGPHDGPPFDGPPDRRGPNDGPPFDRRGPHDGPSDRRGPRDGPPFDRRGPYNGPQDKRGKRGKGNRSHGGNRLQDTPDDNSNDGFEWRGPREKWNKRSGGQPDGRGQFDKGDVQEKFDGPQGRRGRFMDRRGRHHRPSPPPGIDHNRQNGPPRQGSPHLQIPHNMPQMGIPTTPGTPGTDPRWKCFRDSGLENSEEVIIGKRPYEIKVGGRPRKINLNKNVLEVSADPVLRGVLINGNLVYKFGERVKDVDIMGQSVKLFYHGQPKNIWIDGQQFEVRVDAPPKQIFINDRPHKLQIDGRDMMIIIDKSEKGPYGTEPRFIYVDEDRLELRFEPLPKTIMIDGKLCELKLNLKNPGVVIDGVMHGISFDGPPREVNIDDRAYLVQVDKATKHRVGFRPYYISFGGPCFEIIIDGKWYEVRFGEPPKDINVGTRVLKISIPGAPPEVKILEPMMPPDGSGMMPVLAGPGPMGPHMGPPNQFIPVGPDGQPMAMMPIRPGVPPGQEGFHQMVPGQFPPGQGPRPPFMPQQMGQPRPPGPFHHLPPGPEPRGPMFGLLGGPNQPFPGPVSSQLQPMMGQPPVSLSGGRGPPVSGVGSLLSSLFPPPVSAPNSNSSPAPIDINSLFSKLVATGILKNEPKPSVAATTTTSSPAVTAAASTTTTVTASASSTSTSSVKSEPTVTTATHSADIKSDEPISAEDALAKNKTFKETYDDISELTDFHVPDLKKLQSGVIQRLYAGIQCSSCGARFTLDTEEKADKYREHLDWHFRANRREKDEVKVAKNRKWYYGVDDWIQYEEIVEGEEQGRSNIFEQMLHSGAAGNAQGQIQATINVPEGSTLILRPAARGNDNDKCDICHEEFEQFWDEEHEEWHLRDAIRVDEKTYHPICYEDHTDATPTPGDAPVEPPVFKPITWSDTLSATVKREPVRKYPVLTVDPGRVSVKQEQTKDSTDSNNVQVPVATLPESIVAVKQEPVSDDLPPESVHVSANSQSALEPSVTEEDGPVSVKQEPVVESMEVDTSGNNETVPPESAVSFLSLNMETAPFSGIPGLDDHENEAGNTGLEIETAEIKEEPGYTPSSERPIKQEPSEVLPDSDSQFPASSVVAKQVLLETTENNVQIQEEQQQDESAVKAEPSIVTEVKADPLIEPEVKAESAVVTEVEAEPLSVTEVEAEPSSVTEVEAEPSTVTEVKAELSQEEPMNTE